MDFICSNADCSPPLRLAQLFTATSSGSSCARAVASSPLASATRIEAASKSLKSPTYTMIDEFVEKIVKTQMDDDQYLNANITFQEIEAISASSSATAAAGMRSSSRTSQASSMESPTNSRRVTPSAGCDA